MSKFDPSTSDVVASLSSAVDPALLAMPELSRRRFLQAAGAAATISLLPTWLADAAEAATPLNGNEGVLVLLTMGGGNDGLNTFIPVNDGAYHDARKDLAISPTSALPLTATRSLNPHLPFVKNLWDQGDLAVIDGVGNGGATLSHFLSMAQHMTANANGQPGGTGWLGRTLDGLDSNPLTGLAIGTSVPLVMQGRSRRGSAIPINGNSIRQLMSGDPTMDPQFATMKALGAASSGMGPLADRVTSSLGSSLDLADQLVPLMGEPAEEAEVISKLRLAARLINADLGVRIISIIFGDFDSHSNQATMHSERMRELNTGLQTFYSTLSPTFSKRTLIVGTSEFGRRVDSNGSGTDHGAANSLFAIGAQVNGGFHGELPSLTDLDQHHNLRPNLDFRHFYGNVVDTWLGADSAEILGRNYDDIGFLRAPGAAGGSNPKPEPAKPIVIHTGYRALRAEVARLYLAYFLRTPDEQGYEYWVDLRQSQKTLAQISAAFAASGEFQSRYGSLSDAQFVELVYQNVLERRPDAEGSKHWTDTLARGISRGEVMIGFSESPEYRARTAKQYATIEDNGPVGRLYVAYFGRRPDEAGKDYWINTGLPPAAISEQFSASSEFVNRYGALDDAAFVTLAYRNVLGREVDQDGLNHWVSMLRQGTTRGAVMLNFSDSPEFIRRVTAM